MATKIITSQPFTINTGDIFPFGSGNPNQPSTCIAQGTNAAFSGTGLVLKARVSGSGLAFVPLPYSRRDLAGAASDDTTVTAPLAGDFIIKFDCSGLDFEFDNSVGYTSGSFAIGYKILSGPDA